MLHKPIKKAWLLYVCLLTLFAGCSKCNKVVEPDNPTAGLPPATQVGAYTFGCMLNGQPWLPVGQQLFIYPRNPTIIYDPTYNGGDLRLFGSIYSSKPVNGDNLTETVEFGGTNFNKTGEYNLTNSNVYFGYSTKDIQYYSREDITSNCKVIITRLDLTNKIMSGTFSFTLEKKDTGKKVTITDGRFDMKFL